MKNFRSYEDTTLTFDKNLNFIVGDNAKGKTNILEAIYLLCTGTGIKDTKQEQLIRFEQNIADVNGIFENSETLECRIHLSLQAYLTKTYFVNRAKKKLFTYRSETPKAVLFTPDMISIIDGTPSNKRKFFDTVLCDIDMEYQKTLRNYENAMRKRNRIIETERDSYKLMDVLDFWNTYLIDHAHYIQQKRAWLIERFLESAVLDSHAFSITYEPNEITAERFEEYFMKEYYQKRTLIGPQRDVFTFSLQKNNEELDVKTYGSRGEQRLTLLWLLLRHIAIIEQETDSRPLLLLDDIFSELDDTNKKLLIPFVQKYQTFLTTTDRPDSLFESLDHVTITV